jgi:hypothetical protein
MILAGIAEGAEFPASRLPARIRTWDPLIKSQLLYQLSYGEI